MTTMTGLITAMLEQVQVLEDSYQQVLRESGLSGDYLNMVGVQLDRYGAFLGEGRRGASDDEYRGRIAARILVATSQGTASDLENIVNAYAIAINGSPPATVTVVDGAAAEVLVTTTFVPRAREIGQPLIEARAAGVKLFFFYDTDPNPFRFDVPGAGFGDGKFSGVIGGSNQTV